MKITTRSLAHLGLVAGTFKELGIGEVIDTCLPKTRDHNLPHSTALLAMCLNGLGFNESRLYLYPSYFENLPTERLLGEGVLSEHLNDDMLGRTLDRIYEYGCTELFNQIVLQAMKKIQFGTHVLHTDTTSFSLHGKYDNHDPEYETIEITYGYPKDMRWDLKRFVLSMVCNQEGIPLFTEALSGSASDKTTLVETVKNIQESLKLNDKVYHVADSAIYSDDNITDLGVHTLWITRVPATLNEVKNLLNADAVMKTCTDERYSYYETASSYGGIDQKWVLIESEEMKKRKEKTFDKNIGKDTAATIRSLNKLKRTEYACEEDARNAAEMWINEHKRFRFTNISIEKKSRRKNGKIGRPKKGEQLRGYYSLVADIEIDETIIENESNKLGRFVLATNDLSLTADEILSYYKSQSTIERGFKFLKDKSFHVSEVYLKKESRIEALSMIMVLCLFLYSIAQWKLRTKLKETKSFVRNQVKKPVQNPTMRWVFFLFRGVAEVEVMIDKAVETKVANMKDELWKILDMMGNECKNYYH